MSDPTSAAKFFKEANPVDTNIMTGMPSLETPALRNYVNNNIKTTDKDLRGSRDHHADKTRGYTQEQYDTDPTSLNKNQNANYAKDGGQFGRFNNRDYNTTLRLAREADVYNSAPREHHKVIGLNNQIQDLGVQYDKPKLETMETRAMDQAIQLDTEQKQKGIDLQAKVNAKDWEAFKDNFKQLYEANMHTMDKEQMYTVEARVKQLAQYLDKDKQLFNAMLGLHMSTRRIQMILNAAKSGDFLVSQMLGAAMGIKSPLPADLMQQAAYTYGRSQGWSMSECDAWASAVARQQTMQNMQSAIKDDEVAQLNQGLFDEHPTRSAASKEVSAYNAAQGGS